MEMSEVLATELSGCWFLGSRSWPTELSVWQHNWDAESDARLGTSNGFGGCCSASTNNRCDGEARLSTLLRALTHDDSDVEVDHGGKWL
jgi:hypothetical protein